MTLKEVVSKQLSINPDNKTLLVGFYSEDENGQPNKTYSEYADEIVETQGDKPIHDFVYLENHNILIVSAENEDGTGYEFSREE